MSWRYDLKRWISTCLIVIMAAESPISAFAGTGQTAGTESGSPAAYRAELNLDEGGSLTLWKSTDQEQPWNTMEEELVPGTSMIMGSDGRIIPVSVTAQETMSAGYGQYRADGVRLGQDIQGVKSYFSLPDEIVCLGAGMESTAEADGDLITVVDNVPVKAKTLVGLPNPWAGVRYVMNATAASDPSKSWKSVLDTATKGIHATRNWIYADEAPASSDQNGPFEWSYLFPDSISSSNVFYRFNTKGSGKAALFELWVKPSSKKTYAYTMATGRIKKEFGGQAVTEPNNTILENSERLQAVYDKKHEILALNKWTKEPAALENAIGTVSVSQPVSLIMRNSTEDNTLELTVAKPEHSVSDTIEVKVDVSGKAVQWTSNEAAVSTCKLGAEIYLVLDAAQMGTDPVTLVIERQPVPDAGDQSELVLVIGGKMNLPLPEGFDPATVTWSSRFLKEDGSIINNAGTTKKKRELLEGESDGNRVYGPTSASHLASVSKRANGDGLVTANGKGTASILAEDGSGKRKVWTVEVRCMAPEELPEASEEDYRKVRQTWIESLIGKNLLQMEGGEELIAGAETAARTAWDSYAYKGQDSCPALPWPEMEGAAGNPNMPFCDDAVEFRPVIKNVLAMAKAYQMEGNGLYHNQEMLQDMFHILDWWTSQCYTIKTQSDNWWTWEIGIPKDLMPTLVLLSDEMSAEQKERYTKGVRFFQPNPFYQGGSGEATTHVGGYRKMQGANLQDNSVTALGIGAVLEDNEYLYLAGQASSGDYVIQKVADSTKLASNGYVSGFYEDGSYLDHTYVPYMGSYGLDFVKAGVSVASALSQTPWAFGEETIKNLEHFILEGFCSGMYNGLMLDCLKGRSVARKGYDGRTAGRGTMTVILQILDALSQEAQEQIKPQLKYWMEQDAEYIASLGTDAANAVVQEKALAILEDDSIEAYVSPMHKSMPYMDRAIHRTDEYLFALSMFSTRIQNCEVTNSENLCGWHQGDGMTYLYDADQQQYTGSYWASVNPYRLAGTTVVPVNIGNGTADGSGYYQDGDYRSKNQHWAGGSVIGTNGVSGMSLSGDITSDKVSYAPGLEAKKSWFMFEDEIVCLGAGIKNSGQDLPVETTVENRKLLDDGSNRLLADGEEVALEPVRNQLSDIIDGTADTSGTKLEKVSWIHLDGNTDGSQFGYYFPGNQTLSVRKAAIDGNWNQVSPDEGEASGTYLEMWMDHGVNPENASYEYVLLPGKSPEEVEAYAYHPGSTILANTSQVQAVYHEKLGITGANFWTDSETQVGDLTVRGQASVMLEENENGILEIAVSDPTMKNTGTIQLWIDKPVEEIVSQDDNVRAELTEKGGVHLTVSMKGTNGASSHASVQLKAGIVPGAVTMAAGEQQEFVIHDYTGVMGDAVWSVTGNQTALAAGTTIDQNGVLNVDEAEENGSLTVTAVSSDSSVRLTALVSLGGDMRVTIPEEIQAWIEMIEKAEAVAEEADDYTAPGLRQMVWAAVRALDNLDLDELRTHSMAAVIRLEELYTKTEEAYERSLEQEVRAEGSGRISGLDAEGALLNVPLKKNSETVNRIIVEIRELTGEELIPQSYGGKKLDPDTALTAEVRFYLEEDKLDASVRPTATASNARLDQGTGAGSGSKPGSASGSGSKSDSASGSNARPSRASGSNASDRVRSSGTRSSGTGSRRIAGVRIETGRTVRVSTGSSRASGSNARPGKATGSNARPGGNGSHGTIAGANVSVRPISAAPVQESRSEQESENRRELGTLTAPVRIILDVPDGLDLEQMMVFSVSENGTAHLMEHHELDDGRISFVLIQPGRIVFAQPAAETEKPDDPKDDPDNPKDDEAREALQDAVEQALLRSEQDYTPESWKAFAKALKDAKQLLNDSKASSEEIMAVLRRLKRTEAALLKASGDNNGSGEREHTSREKQTDHSNAFWRYVPERGWTVLWNGTTPKSQWLYLPWNQVFSWYYFDQDGYMVTGWLQWNGDWYYLYPISDGTCGRMLTGWQTIDGKQYYFNEVSDGRKGAWMEKQQAETTK